MAKQDYSPIKAAPLRGGIDTRRRVALLPFGAYSQVQNLRPRRPGFIKRPGQSKLHTTADGTNGVMTLYQFKKRKVAEQHFYAQFTDSDILEATANPPTVTSGVFGTEIFSGTANPKPASWAVIEDQLIFANGVDRHQIYGGNSSYVHRAVVYTGTTAITTQDVVEEGFDYSDEVKIDDTTKTVILDGLGTDADNYLAIMTPVPAVSFTFDIYLPNANDVPLSAIEYAKTDNTWADVSGLSDTTVSGTTTMAVDGTVSFTAPTDIKPTMLYGQNGYWYKLKFEGGALDSEVEINTITFNSAWTNLVNKWDGVTTDPAEVWVEFTAANEWSKYSAAAVDIGSLPASRRIVLFCPDPIDGIYTDVGETPNSEAVTISTIKYWDGDSFASVGTFNDGTNNGTNTMANSGWITFPKQTAHPHQFQSDAFYAYVYEITISATALSADMNVGFEVRPYYDITEWGKGNTCCAWKERVTATFTEYPNLVFISGKSDPQIFNGDDYGVVEVGDGRQHEVNCMRAFYQNLLVWQEEKGIEGGCLTMIQGYSAATFGKFIISTRVGCMNSKSAIVIDGITVSTQTDEQIKTIAFWLSRYGICATDGHTVWTISDPIQNYFDSTDSNSIRLGYEDKMWLKYDSTFQILRIGLVTGSSATVPNTFLVYDLVDHAWYTDTLGQELLCMEETEAGSGDDIILQIGGGTDDGFIYLLNSGQNDVSTAVDSSITLELDGRGEIINLTELVVRCEAQAAGNINLTIKANDITKVNAKTLSMIAEVASQADRRHRINLNIVDGHISITLSHGAASQDMYLYDLGVKSILWKRK
jgi:hypothetical protein